MATSPPIQTAFILAGGRGIRMRRLGHYIPKCALVVYDQPLLVRQIEACRKAGVTRIILSIGERHEDLIRSILKPLEAQIRIEVFLDRALAGPVRALLSSAEHLAGRDHFFLLSDIYLEREDFFHTAQSMDLRHLVLNTQTQPDPDLISAGCNVVLEGERIRRILEKPPRDQIVGNTCWTGLSVHPSAFFERVDALLKTRPLESISHVGQLYQELLTAGLGVLSCPEQGRVVNVTTPDDLLVVNALEFRKIRALRPNEKRTTWDALKEVFR